MTAGWPGIIVEAGFTPAGPGAGVTDLILGDGASGLLGTGTLGTSTVWTALNGYIGDTPIVQAVTITRSSTRQQGPLTMYEAGTATIVLANSDGRFSPENLAGPYVVSGQTQVRPMIPIRVRATWGSLAYSLFTGYVRSWTPPTAQLGPDYDYTVVQATDAFCVLAGITIPAIGSLAGVGELSGARVARILAAAGWYATAQGLSDIDPGQSAVQGTTFGATALSLLQLTADSEVADLYTDGAGRVTFRDRHAPLTDPRSTTVQAVFGDLADFALWQVQWAGDGVTATPGAQSQQVSGVVTPGGTYQASALFYSPQGWSNGQLNVLWFTSAGGFISTGAGIQASIPAGVPALVTTGPLTAPAGAARYTIVPQMTGTPASSVVMNAAWNHGAAASELSSNPGPGTWSGNNTATVTNLGTAPAAWYPAELPYAEIARPDDDTTMANDSQATINGSANMQQAQDAASIARFLFPRSYERSDLILQSDADALGWAQYVLAISRNDESRFDALTLQADADPDDLFPQVLGRELGDRIQVWRHPPGTAAISKDCFIRSITHTITVDGWVTEWGLQNAARYSFMVLGDPILGQLGANALAFLGLPLLPVLRVIDVDGGEDLQDGLHRDQRGGVPLIRVHAGRLSDPAGLGQDRPLGRDLAAHPGRHYRALILLQPGLQERDQVIHPSTVLPGVAWHVNPVR